METNEKKETAEDKKPQDTQTGSGNGDKSEATSLVERASQERERLDKTLAEIKKERMRLEELKASEILGGRTSAGQQQTPKEETPKEYKERVLSGKL